MGIGWIGNILFFSKHLLFIAYIMTVFIAGQGILIFIIYVPLSSHVRLTIIMHLMLCQKLNTHSNTITGQRSIHEMVEEETVQLFNAQ